MDFRVLGPLSVQDGGEEVLQAGGKPRQLLALLLLNEPHRVSPSSLITELWDDTPPRRPMTTLQTHVFHLRREFAQKLGVSHDLIAADLLQTRDSGYRIVLGEASFDLPEFHRRRLLAQTLLTSGNVLTASQELSNALSLWRGPALMEVEHGRLLSAAVAELDQSRLNTITLFFDTQLTMSRHREILSELARLVVLHPDHEELHVQFAIALHRSGYRSQALTVLDELHHSMHDALGTAPSARNSRLWKALQAADPAVVDSRPVTVSPREWIA